MIDTGASSLVICEAMALELNLPPGAPVELLTSGGTIVGRRVCLTSISIGRIVVRNVVAVVHPTGACTEVLVGLSVLKELRTVVLRGQRLRLVGDKAGPRAEWSARPRR
jgi:aspartyl protease family protein